RCAPRARALTEVARGAGGGEWRAPHSSRRHRRRLGSAGLLLSKLDASAIDPRVGAVDERKLRESDACILNVDYPLGEAAYHILRQVAEQAAWVAGVYVLGKAATLNADVGDVMIPNAVYNEHSGNT